MDAKRATLIRIVIYLKIDYPIRCERTLYARILIFVNEMVRSVAL